MWILSSKWKENRILMPIESLLTGNNMRKNIERRLNVRFVRKVRKRNEALNPKESIRVLLSILTNNTSS
jgi:hypothetical protein